MGCQIEAIYTKEIQKAWKENVAAVRADPNLADKVARWAVARGWDVTKVLEKVATDDMFASVFAKNPTRQTIHQRIAASYIEKLDGIDDFKVLPAGGKNALYCVDGQVVSLDNPQGIKSIDFTWKYVDKQGRSYSVFASHKHTMEEGGAQDNQFNDVMGFLVEATKNTADNVLFVAICDGAYYDHRYTRDAKYKGSRLDYLKNVVSGRNRRATACQSDDIIKTMQGMTAF